MIPEPKLQERKPEIPDEDHKKKLRIQINDRGLNTKPKTQIAQANPLVHLSKNSTYP